MLKIVLAFALGLSSIFIPLKNVAKASLEEETTKAFIHAWNNYKKYAWGKDTLAPLTKEGTNWYQKSLLMTPVDAFDTMKIMGLAQQATEAKKLILENLNFNQDQYVQVFEVTIRLLGGLLSAYFFDGDVRFLTLAQDLADRLLPAFNSPTGMPYTHVNLATGKTKNPVSNPAEIGTLLLEFGTLSKLTKKDVYYNKAFKALQTLFSKRSSLDLVGTQINVETGVWTEKNSHLSGMIDSYYEYLLKGYLLFKDEKLKEMWRISEKAISTHLSHQTDLGLWYKRVNMFSGATVATVFGALDAFYPAVLALDGQIKTSAKLLQSVFLLWDHYGIIPETTDYKTFIMGNPSYHLRPESIESTFYLYQLTKKTCLQNKGVSFLKKINDCCKLDSGYTSISNVQFPEPLDTMPSFFLAETLKYFYLLGKSPEFFPLDDYVFNTEAHPIPKNFRPVNSLQ